MGKGLAGKGVQGKAAQGKGLGGKGLGGKAQPHPGKAPQGKQIFAAGTVCWRRVTAEDGSEQVMVLLIHRAKQRDVSFPKGKLDPGESMPQAAVRETKEETGLDIALGLHLGTISYALSGGHTKIVQYWAAEVTPEIALASSFTPNREIAAAEWVPLERARKRLSYKADRELYDVFVRLAEHDLLETFAITLLRHAKAEPGGAAFDEDRLRPLAALGIEQAHTLVPSLQAFGPRRVYASTATRCVSTVTPLVEHLGKRLRTKTALSQDHWDAGELSELRTLMAKIIARRKSVVLRSHLPVLPDLARELALATASVPGRYLDEAATLPPGGFAVFHASRKRPGAGILGVESYPFKR